MLLFMFAIFCWVRAMAISRYAGSPAVFYVSIKMIAR